MGAVAGAAEDGAVPSSTTCHGTFPKAQQSVALAKRVHLLLEGPKSVFFGSALVSGALSQMRFLEESSCCCL